MKNPIEFIIIEMTPVITIDSSSIHALEDMNTTLRSMGIQLGFAQIGNRVHKVFELAKFTEHIGESWFHRTVNDAVVHCIKVQREKSLNNPHSSLMMESNAEEEGNKENMMSTSTQNVQVVVLGENDDGNHKKKSQDN